MPPDDPFESNREHLFAFAYRMLGSVSDAEDMVQEAYLRWHGEDTARIDAPRSWLTKVVARLCIDSRRAARRRRETYVGPWLPEPLVANRADPAEAAQLADSLGVAFLVLLESLGPVERAAFLLRKVFDFDYAAIGAMLDKSESNCRQMVHRAEGRMAEGRPRREATRAESERLAGEFLHACMSGDLDGLVGMLAQDAVLTSDGGGKALAARRPIAGANPIARFLLGILKKAPAGAAIRPAWVNGAPGFVATVDGEARQVLTLEVQHGRIQNIYIVVNPDKLVAVQAAIAGD